MEHILAEFLNLNLQLSVEHSDVLSVLPFHGIVQNVRDNPLTVLHLTGIIERTSMSIPKGTILQYPSHSAQSCVVVNIEFIILGVFVQPLGIKGVNGFLQFLY